jgi:hypothetical protein
LGGSLILFGVGGGGVVLKVVNIKEPPVLV